MVAGTMDLRASRQQLLYDSLGIMVSAGGFGLVYGLTAGEAGLSPIEAGAMSVFGPSILAALAAVNTIVVQNDAGRPAFYVGPEWIAVALCILVVGLRKSLLIGLILAAGSIALLPALGLAQLP